MEIEPVIGLEVHVELATRSKMFCGCSTKFGEEPNSQVCPVCLGLPGVLPVVNREAVRIGIKTALALNCQVAEITLFDRKNYYYPDLPKNYQISQQYHPLGVEGWVEIDRGKDTKRIRIHNLHLEEDAGKNLHEEGENYSLVDLNRAGIPLLEIVTYPDMNELEEVKVFMETLRNILIYIGASDCRMEQGHLRFEANISVRRKGEKELGPKVEIKNLNSFRMVLQALEYEIERQKELLLRGERILQETRLWDEERNISLPMRFKEEAQDYRYFPEPDIPPLRISSEWIEEIRRELPELPHLKKRRYIRELGISEKEAEIITGDKDLSEFFERTLALYSQVKPVVNWITGPVLRELNERKKGISETSLSPEYLAIILQMLEKKLITQTNAKYCLREVFNTGKNPEEIVREKGWIQVSDEETIEAWVREVIESNPQAVKDYQSGKKSAISFLVGQVMKLSRGKANPQKVQELLREKLG